MNLRLYARPHSSGRLGVTCGCCRLREDALDAAVSSVVGHVRSRNEDAYLHDPQRRLLAVADGLGGHVGGHVASRTAMQTVDRILTGQRLAAEDPMELLDEALRLADQQVVAAADDNPSLAGMGTTAVIAHIDDQARTVTVGHVGDSRAYALHEDRLCRITEDHVARGVFGRSLSQALGTQRGVEPEVAEVTLAVGDRLLLCTDGLTDMLSDDEIGGLLASPEGDEATCGALVDTALDRGGVDNVTVLVTTIPEQMSAPGAGTDRTVFTTGPGRDQPFK